MCYIDEIQKDILAADLESDDGANELERKLESKYCIRELATFAGYDWVLQYQSSFAAVQRYRTMWEKINHECYIYLGAAAVVEMQGTKIVRMVGGKQIAVVGGLDGYAGDGNTPTLMDMKLGELKKQIPVGLRNRIEKAVKPTRSAQAGTDRKLDELIDGAKKGVEVITALMDENKKLKTCIAELERDK
jgi:hypothetical protein